MQKCEISAREVRDRALSEEKGLAMGRRDVRLESLRELESHGFVLKSRVSAIRSTLLLSCLVLSTVAVVAWGIVTRPRREGG